MTNDARAFRLQDEINEIGHGDNRADTISQSNLAANSFATEARTLLNDREFVASLEGPDSTIPALTVINDEHGNPTAFEIFSEGGMPIDFFKDGSSNSNGLTVRRDDKGNPTSYEKYGYSVQLHQDRNTWYYHNDHSGEAHKWVAVDQPTLNDAGMSRPDVDIRSGSVTIGRLLGGDFTLGEPA